MAAGIAAAVIICGSFSVIEIESSAMLPDYEPGMKVIVDKRCDGNEVSPGDIVAVELPYYAINDEGHYAVREVKEKHGNIVKLICGSESVSDEILSVDVDDIAGKVIASFG